MMKTIRTIGNISTLTELKLVRKNLRQQLRHNEETIKIHTGEIVAGVKAVILGIMIQQSLTYLIGRFVRTRK